MNQWKSIPRSIRMTPRFLRIALHGEGIKCEITGELQGGFAGIGMTPVRLYVRAEDYDRARSYIESHQQRK